MTKKNKNCQDCHTALVTFKSIVYDILIDEQTRLKKIKRRHISIDFVTNRIISEWQLWTDHQTKKLNE